MGNFGHKTWNILGILAPSSGKSQSRRFPVAPHALALEPRPCGESSGRSSGPKMATKWRPEEQHGERNSRKGLKGPDEMVPIFSRRREREDQVDTLTFQNQGLRDKAKRFEEALRRSTDEQILEALAPYQHIEQDLRSLKEVVEMKNQQIHQQEMKISHLEKVAQKNVTLEEKVQLLQQQNEDLKARIDMNLALSRQLSEENANLQTSVEKESTEKKRLSRNNEELLWRLQSSPLASPASSPLHRSSSPVPACGSPSHCQGCPRQALFTSPSHGASGPATPTHRAAAAAACLGSPPPRHAPPLF